MLDLEKEALTFPVKRALAYIPSTPFGLKEKAFLGETFFTAPNPPFGAVFTYYLKDEVKTKRKARLDAEKEADKKGAAIAYPDAAALRAEAREEDPAVVLTVKDADGNVVRRLTGPVKAGIHRVAWDLRFPARGPDVPQAGPDPRREPLLRRARRARSPCPGRTPCRSRRGSTARSRRSASPQTFQVESLGLQTLKAEDAKELLAFQKKTARLQRAVLGADRGGRGGAGAHEGREEGDRRHARRRPRSSAPRRGASSGSSTPSSSACAATASWPAATSRRRCPPPIA